jgi:threonine aldolase
MRAAIAAANVGDEQLREDLTVAELQQRVAGLLGHEQALFLPTATMANQIALRLHSQPGDVLIAEATSHVLIYEFGGAAVHAGLVMLGLPGHGGRITGEQIRAAAPPHPKTIDQVPSILVLEDTHNSSGGQVWPLDDLQSVLVAARDAGLAVHLDGARLFNAAVAQGVPPSTVAAGFDTVTVCLSKGLGCPLGALIVGSHDLIERAWREKHLFGGAMRQAGIVAAAGLYAFDNHVARLADDHARARRLAVAWHGAGLAVEPERVETNFVQIDLAPLGLSPEVALERLRGKGVGLSSTIHPSVVRAVTHLDITDEDVERASEIVPDTLRAESLGGRSSA